MTAPTPFDVIADTMKSLASKFSEQLAVTGWISGPGHAEYR